MSRCPHCGNAAGHEGRCPIVKAIEYFEDGTIKRVEYLTPADYVSPYSVPPQPVQPPSPFQPTYTPFTGPSCGYR